MRCRVGHRAHKIVEMRLHVIVVLILRVLHLLFGLGDLRVDVVARNLGARNAVFQIARRGAELTREAFHGRAHGAQGARHLRKLNRAAIRHVFDERVERIGQLGVVRRLIGQAVGVRDERLRDRFAAIVRRRERVVYRGRHAVEARHARINRAGERIGRGIHGIGDRRGRRLRIAHLAGDFFRRPLRRRQKARRARNKVLR